MPAENEGVECDNERGESCLLGAFSVLKGSGRCCVAYIHNTKYRCRLKVDKRDTYQYNWYHRDHRRWPWRRLRSIVSLR